MSAYEVNFDGLVGPTHNYAGLSFGNVASSKHASQTSSPQQAALQGLQKMKALADMGMKQAVLPPHERPHIASLKNLGITAKSDSGIIARALKEAPYLLRSCTSASAMWVANAATISPYPDTADGKTHITPANLCSMFHRAIEPPVTGRILQSIFRSDDFVHHKPLPAGPHFSDEGAANHTRFCRDYHEAGVEFFVYGASSFDPDQQRPKKFPARQTQEACQAISRRHALNPNHVVIAQQHPDAIDAGVFHNDVIAVGNRNVLFYHQNAFLDNQRVVAELQSKLHNIDSAAAELIAIEVPAQQVSLHNAVSSYLFNSQLISVPGSTGTTIIVPTECEQNKTVKDYLMNLVDSEAAIDEVKFFDLRQSMNNGGGPACLRLRVVMTQYQIDNTKARVFLDDSLYNDLEAWIKQHYRDRLEPADLTDPNLLHESRTALSELTELLNLGSVYDFQGDNN